MLLESFLLGMGRVYCSLLSSIELYPESAQLCFGVLCMSGNKGILAPCTNLGNHAGGCGPSLLGTMGCCGRSFVITLVSSRASV